jgi:multidrug efflux pump subunit AcrA (membrane-fusion protein)
MRVLQDKDYGTKKQMVTTKEGAIAEAQRAIERVKNQAAAKIAQAEAARKAAHSVYEQEQGRYQDLESEIKKCILTAPQSGMVVYFIPEQTRFGGGAQQSTIAQGEPVKEGQKLMRIPDLNKMLVDTRVHEALVSRVRGEKWQRTGFSDAVQAAVGTTPHPFGHLMNTLAFASIRSDFSENFKEQEQTKMTDGQPATIRVDAFPDRILRGHVKSVATVASQQDFMSADVKVYQTKVAIDEQVEGLKPGMSAVVTILTDSRREHVLAIPVQAIVGTVEMGRSRQCFVVTPTGPEEREIVVGLSNEKMAEVKSGLNDGDQVVLNPRTLLAERERKTGVAPSALGKGDFPAGMEGKGWQKGEGKGGRSKGGMPNGSWNKGGMPNGGGKGGWNKGDMPGGAEGGAGRSAPQTDK